LSFEGVFSIPSDGPRIVALVASLAAGALLPRLLGRRGRLWPELFAPLLAALLSAGYVAYYLRGGPRIVDATSYWLQARALSEGMLAWPIAEPEQGVLGRFLLRTTVDGQPGVTGIFPPGFPAVLAVGFALGAPLAVGPVIAAVLVVATVHLCRQVVRCGPQRWRPLEPTLINGAATLSVACAALRYHTADTMSHGLAALWITTALGCLLRACAEVKDGRPLQGTSHLDATVGLGARARRLAPVVLLGLSGGGLLATRPVSALALAVTAAVALVTLPGARGLWRLSTGLACALAAIPGAVLWLAHGHAATGEIGLPAQSAYYALSDGPPGCFRYGFGAGIGCLGEHGAFVRHNLPDGSYGSLEALGTTLRRLKQHLADPLNLAPLFPLVLIGAIHSWRQPAARLLSLAVALQVACYAPFYFDGNYPGGGARMFADVLPVEHVLAVLGLVALARPEPVAGSRPARGPSLALLTGMTIGLSLLGFAVRGGVAHAQLRDREGGRPMFEPSVVAEHGASGALLLVDTDHGFNLGHDPTGRTLVARRRGDDLDRLTWEHHGRPPVFRYRYTWATAAAARPWLEQVIFDPTPTDQLELTVQGESLWPPAGQLDGWVWPSYTPLSCVTGGRLLALYPTQPGQPASVQLRLPASLAGRSVAPRIVKLPGEPSGVHEPPVGEETGPILELYDGQTAIARWPLDDLTEGACATLDAQRVPREVRDLGLQLRSKGPIAIDSLIFGKKR